MRPIHPLSIVLFFTLIACTKKDTNTPSITTGTSQFELFDVKASKVTLLVGGTGENVFPFIPKLITGSKSNVSLSTYDLPIGFKASFMNMQQKSITSIAMNDTVLYSLTFDNNQQKGTYYPKIKGVDAFGTTVIDSFELIVN